MLLYLLALLVLVVGGVAAVALSRRPAAASACGAAAAVAGCVLALAPTLAVLVHGEQRTLAIPWGVPAGRIVVGVDPLSAFFFVPLSVLCAAAAIYGHAYLAGAARKRAIGGAWLAFALLIASMMLVLLARNGLLFLVAWEAMALASYVLVSWEHERPEVRRAGWTYLIATHTATAFLIAMFLILGRRAGSLEFAAFLAAPPPGASAALGLFALSAIGFGTKAGFFPLHVWLPEAHAAAPSHVSAVMSGVLIKLGLYGLLRTVTFLGPHQVLWGPILMTIGLSGGLFGIALALYQRDMKRVLAYSSIENVGVIAFGLGLGFWGQATGRPAVAALGFGGGLLHVWNHTLMKGSMFLCAGSVLHGTGTKDLERLGGVARRMPVTGALMVAGAVAISGLPPLNGFVSEWLVYVGLIDTGVTTPGSSGLLVLLAVGLLSLVGGLTAACFVRLAGIALLGEPRSPAAQEAHESSAVMTAPIALLLALCAGCAVAPVPIVTMAANVAAELGAPPALAYAPLATVGRWNAAILAAIVVLWALWSAVKRRRPVAYGPTWGCGFAGASPRVQYTASSFSELAAERVLPRALRASTVELAPDRPFATSGRFASDTSDPLTRSFYEPFLQRWAQRFARLRWMQQGVLHVYLVYILAVVLVALAWVPLRAWWSGG